MISRFSHRGITIAGRGSLPKCANIKSTRHYLHQQHHGSNKQQFSAGAATAAASEVIAVATMIGIVGVTATTMVVAEGERETGGGAWGRRGMTQGKYYGVAKKTGEGSDAEPVQGEDEKFFDPDYEYLMVSSLPN